MKISKALAQLFSSMIDDAVANDINSLQITTRRHMMGEPGDSEAHILHYWHSEETGGEYVRISACCPLEPKALNPSAAERFTLQEFRNAYTIE